MDSGSQAPNTATEGSDDEDFSNAQATPTEEKRKSSSAFVPDMFKRSSNKRRRGNSGSPRNGDLVEKIKDIVAKENNKLRETLKTEQQEMIETIKKDFQNFAEDMKNQLMTMATRIRELEEHVREKDKIIDDLETEAHHQSKWCREQQDALDELEQKSKSYDVILSGPAVPARPRPSADAAPAPPLEDTRRTACDVIRRSFAGVQLGRGQPTSVLADIDENELTEVRRLGPRTLLCRFARAGPGSARETLLENKLRLRGKTRDESLFISESLSDRRHGWFRDLLQLKKNKCIYTVFSKKGQVYVKVSQHSQKILIDSYQKVKAVSERRLNAGS